MRLLISALCLIVVGASAGLFLQASEVRKARETLSQWQPSQIDIGFSQAMSRHHQQAITMAQLLLDGRPTGLAPMARAISSTQLLELGEMRGWLRLWNQPWVSNTENMAWMLLSEKPLDDELNQYLIDCRSAPGGMPGLASEQELNQLRSLDTRARDKLFLTLMLAHHEGGVPMARFTASEGSLEAVRKLAANMVLEQTKEIHQIRSILAAYDMHPGE